MSKLWKHKGHFAPGPVPTKYTLPFIMTSFSFLANTVAVKTGFSPSEDFIITSFVVETFHLRDYFPPYFQITHEFDNHYP